MNTLTEFFVSLPAGHPIHKARADHARLLAIFEEEDTGGTEIPALFSAATRLRSEVEELAIKPQVVTAFIELLDADVRMMRAIINLREKP